MPRLIAVLMTLWLALAGTAQAAEAVLPLTPGEDGKLIATLPKPDADGTSLRLIHSMRLTAGLGSNPLGLDRGWGTGGAIVRFRVTGGRVTLEVENQTYRALTDNADERRAVEQSFGRSIIFSGPVIEETDEGVTVDIAPLLLADLLGLAQRLSEDGAGSFGLDRDRSRIEPEGVLVFPLNSEVDAELTFASTKPGREVSATAPYPGAVTLTVHHSFVQLPDDGYTTKPADPRSGTFTVDFYDFAAPLDQPVTRSFAMRHRLTNDDPIVFYVDRGAPEPIRQALIEGASWWAEGFAAAGYPEGYRVEVLPEGAHLLDARYNVIQWVHRQTRGWSYGGAVSDPRTGEMLKGAVILGSQRVRQDRMIFEGLAGTAKSGTGEPDDPVELALARIRQLAAHEVGHALGFGHNFAASANDRASVMDYPAPWVIEKDGDLDFSNAYATGLGPWDILTARWLYGGEDGDALIAEARAKGLLFIEDEEGRGAGTAHPLASVWDNGADPVAELENVLRVRQVALERFGTGNLAAGRPAGELQQVLVPVYLYHRYQTAAAAKLIGGASYQYAKLGEDIPEVTMVPAGEQRRALEAVLGTLHPRVLTLPEEVLVMMTPRADAFQDEARREAFGRDSAPLFDPVSAAESAADITLGALLAPPRLERLAQFEARSADALPLDEVLASLVAATFSVRPTEAQEAAIAGAVQGRVIAALIAADRRDASPFVRGALRQAMSELGRQLDRSKAPVSGVFASQLRAHLERPAPAESPEAEGARIPPGSPIGEDCWHCEGF